MGSRSSLRRFDGGDLIVCECDCDCDSDSDSRTEYEFELECSMRGCECGSGSTAKSMGEHGAESEKELVEVAGAEDA